MTNTKLATARKIKNDEFYTYLSDIEDELKYYSECFAGKTIYCNCDDPKSSNFYKYFSENFEGLHLKKLIVSCYKTKQQDLFGTKAITSATILEMTGTNQITVHDLKGDGDFRSQECIEALTQADVIVTNPPFSLFREYMAQLIQYKKRFLVIGNLNAVGYSQIFPLFKNNQITCGVNAGNMGFQTDKNAEESSFCNICWFTNLPKEKQNEFMVCTKKYNPKDYPKYDNYNAINVDKIKDIPMDYDGVMGVPITFMTKYNPDQFEVIDTIGRYSALDGGPTPITKGKYLTEINKKPVYRRIIIRHKT